ncbi:MAG: BamA/TamA family outer membrane protein [Chitinivibrionales bacterium]|nr:BamA/TamA family outer membrane protein [Chitinivibrionales bacterium]
MKRNTLKPPTGICGDRALSLPVLSFLLIVGLLAGRACATDSTCAFALVLSGGGSRGMAQIGVLRAFEEAGLEPDLIVGTSMGAIVAALYAAGHSADAIERFARKIDWREIFANSAERKKLLVSQKEEPIDYLIELRFEENLKPCLPSGISHGQQIYNYLLDLLVPAQYHARGNFDSLPIPLRVVATDILTGRSILVRHGNLVTALRASSGVPLAFSPVVLDSMLLMDGGLTANIPVEPALNEGCTYVAAVNVTSPLWAQGDLDNPVRLMDQVIAIGIAARKEEEQSRADIIIKPQLDGLLNTDFSRIDTAIARGYRAGLEAVPRIATALGTSTPVSDSLKTHRSDSTVLLPPIRLQQTEALVTEAFHEALRTVSGDSSDGVSRAGIDSVLHLMRSEHRLPYCRITRLSVEDSSTLVDLDPGYVSGVRVHGNEQTNGRMIEAAIGIEPGDIVRTRTLSVAVATLYATGLFNTVHADMDSENIVHVFVEEKDYLRARLGLRFDEFLLGEGYVEPAYENLFGLGISCVLHLQYGLRREKYALDLSGNHLISPWWANNVRFQAYIAREAIVEREELPDTTDTTGTRYFVTYSEQSLRKAGLLFLIGTDIGKTAMLSGGIRLERFESFQTDRGVFADGLGPFKRMRYLMARLTVDDLDRHPFPRRGHRHFLSIGGAHDRLSETESFLKIDGSFSYHATFGKRHTVWPSLRIGWSSHGLPIVEKFYLGGVIPEERYRLIGVYNHIGFMGMRPRALVGDILAVLRVGYRFRIARKTYLNALLDWGYAWQEPEFAFTSEYLRRSLEAAPLGVGLGLAYDSPIGPVRFTWGRLLRNAHAVDEPIPSVERDNVFYFSVGHDF